MYPNEEITTNENLTQDFNSDTNINTNTQSINNMTVDGRSYDEPEVYPTPINPFQDLVLGGFPTEESEATEEIFLETETSEPLDETLEWEIETQENLPEVSELIPNITTEEAKIQEQKCEEDLTNYIDQDFKRSSGGNISTDVTKSLDKQIQFNIQELARSFLTEKLSIPKTTPMSEVEKILQESNLLVDLDVSKDSNGIYFITCNILTKKHSQKFKLSIKNEVSYENV